MPEEKFIYKKHSIDDIIVNVLQSRDRDSFSSKHKIFFFKELAFLLKGGISLLDALKIVYESTDNYAVKEIAKNIMGFFSAGKSLSYALNRLPDYFDEGDYNIIKAGEKSGNLDIVLQSLAAEYVYVSEIKNKYIGALIYPTVLLVGAVVAVFCLFTLVLPGIFDIANSFNMLKMPTATLVLKSISDFFRLNRQVLLIIIGSLLLVGFVFLSTEIGKKTWFKFLLGIPLIGKMTKYYYLVKMCRYMKMMLVAGMDYLEVFRLLRDILDVPLYKGLLENILSGLQRGETIYDGIKLETDLISSDVALMFKVGEETASLPVAVDNVLQMYENELNVLINNLAKVIEPILLVFIGIVIVFVARGVFGLILQIMEGAGM